MDPPLKKAQKENIEETQGDIITHIPENIKEKILNYLPLKKAVRTSILSKAWRSTWTTIPDIIFPFPSDSREEFIERVYSVLSQHKGPINKFEISLQRNCSDHLERWLLHLSKNGIKDLDLFMRNNKLPLGLFSCHALNKIQLSFCLLELPLGFEGFKLLNTLRLTCVAISTKDFEKLVSSSPKLENLCLFELEEHESRDLIINGPNLKKVDIWTNFASIEINAPKLVVFEYLELGDPPIRNNNSNNNIIRALGCVPQVEILRLGNNSLMYFSYAIPVAELGLSFPNLREIEVTELNFEDDKIAIIMLFLLEKSPNLEILDIRMYLPKNYPQHPIINYWGSLNLRDYVFGRLKLVTIRMFEFETMDITLSFVKMILECSPNLERLHLLKGNIMHKKSDEKRYFRKLRKLRTANRTAEIVYELDNDVVFGYESDNEAVFEYDSDNEVVFG